MARKTTPGVIYRHSRNCTNHETCANRCNDSSTPWEAWVYDAKYVDPKDPAKRGVKIRKRFDSHAAAKGWRQDAAAQVGRRELQAVDRATARRTLREEVEEWLQGASAGSILNNRKERYKPAVLRGYEIALRLRVLPTLGDRRLDSIAHRDLLALQEQLQGAGASGSLIRASFVPLQAILRRAKRRGVIPANPALDLELPSAGRRERAATPEQAAELLSSFEIAREALAWVDSKGKQHEPDYRVETALWATAFYAGLRRGEMRALRVSDVDLEASTLTVERGWDDKEGAIAPKSQAGRRTVFMLDALRPFLEPLVDGRAEDDLVFGGDADDPFDPRPVARKAARAWDAVDKARADAAEESGEEEEPAKLDRFGLHEARHSFSTWCDHAGISADRADRYMGHSRGGVAQLYRHLLESQRDDDRSRLDAYVSGVAAGKVVQLAAAQ